MKWVTSCNKYQCWHMLPEIYLDMIKYDDLSMRNEPVAYFYIDKTYDETNS